MFFWSHPKSTWAPSASTSLIQSPYWPLQFCPLEHPSPLRWHSTTNFVLTLEIYPTPTSPTVGLGVPENMGEMMGCYFLSLVPSRRPWSFHLDDFPMPSVRQITSGETCPLEGPMWPGFEASRHQSCKYPWIQILPPVKPSDTCSSDNVAVSSWDLVPKLLSRGAPQFPTLRNCSLSKWRC